MSKRLRYNYWIWERSDELFGKQRWTKNRREAADALKAGHEVKAEIQGSIHYNYWEFYSDFQTEVIAESKEEIATWC